jgi:alkylated DNA repair dioxygenase AlkB
MATTRKFIRSKKVPGLFMLDDVISESEEDIIINKPHNKSVGACYKTWHNEKEVQTKNSSSSEDKPPFDWLQTLWSKIMHETDLSEIIKDSGMFDSAMVADYSAGDILHSHKDSIRIWGDWIACLSLQSDTIIKFAAELLTPHKVTKFITMSHSIPIPRRSMYIMTGDARYVWTHEIERIERERISINFRPFKKNETTTNDGVETEK